MAVSIYIPSNSARGFPFLHTLSSIWVSLVAQMVKNLPAMWETQVQSLGREDPLEKGMAIHSLENSLDRGAWWAIVDRVAKSRT